MVNGEPTLTLTAPIMASVCTLDDTCLVLGSSSGTGKGVTVGQVTKGITWKSLNLPHTNSATFQGGSCWKDGCFIYGSTIEGDLLWRFRSTTLALTPLTPPSTSPAVEAVSCFRANSCAIIDMGGGNSAPQFFTTTDAGATWSTPTKIPFDATSLACTTELKCVAASNASTWRTLDGGVNWKESAPTAGTLINLSCFDTNCVADDTNTTHDHVWRSNDFGKSWSSSPLANRTFAFACLTDSHCVSAGQTTNATGAVSTINGSGASDLAVNYFPNPITTMACGSSRCVAGGLYSVALFKP